MPKKTRKEKLRAEIRRVSVRPTTVSSSVREDFINDSVHLPSDGLFRYQAQVTQQLSPAVKMEQTTELMAIRKDLMKTLVLSLFAFAGELALYWRWELKP